MEIIQLYDDFSIDYVTEGHKHCRVGWVNIECPFCSGNPGYHLGYNIEEEYFHCWRCGGKSDLYVFAKILNKSIPEVKELLQQYGEVTTLKPAIKIKIRKKGFKFPSNVDYLSAAHVRYLHDRNFDPYDLIKTWDLMATGPISKLDNIDYKHRIIIPYYWDDKIVTFDSRSIALVKSDAVRYIACPLDRELIHRKHILYGKQSAWKDTGIIVEGPTDVWRLGPLSCATSGIQYTNKQMRLIAKSFKRVAVVYDNQPQAILQADKLISELKFRNVDAFRIDIEDDPGNLSQKEAEYLIKNIMS